MQWHIIIEYAWPQNPFTSSHRCICMVADLHYLYWISMHFVMCCDSQSPGPCLATAIWWCHNPFSQWECSFQRKLHSHWLKFLRQHHVAVVIQALLWHMLLYVDSSRPHITRLGPIFYLWLSKVSANERRCYICIVFSHCLRTWTTVDINQALPNKSKHFIIWKTLKIIIHLLHKYYVYRHTTVRCNLAICGNWLASVPGVFGL